MVSHPQCWLEGEWFSLHLGACSLALCCLPPLGPSLACGTHSQALAQRAVSPRPCWVQFRCLLAQPPPAGCPEHPVMARRHREPNCPGGEGRGPPGPSHLHPNTSTLPRLPGRIALPCHYLRQLPHGKTRESGDCVSQGNDSATQRPRGWEKFLISEELKQ